MEQKNDVQFFLRPDQFLSLTYDKVFRHRPVSVVEAVRGRGLRAVGEAGRSEGGAGGGKGGGGGQGRVAWGKRNICDFTNRIQALFSHKTKKYESKCLLLLVKTFRGGDINKVSLFFVPVSSSLALSSSTMCSVEDISPTSEAPVPSTEAAAAAPPGQ